MEVAYEFPYDMVDENLRTDYAKIRHLITVDKRLNGNFHAIETVVSGGQLAERLVRSFQAKDIAKRENFISLLYWLGITTIVGSDMGTPLFGIPNGALRQIAAQMFTEAYSDACGIDQRLPAINSGLRAFAAKGTWDALLGPQGSASSGRGGGVRTTGQGPGTAWSREPRSPPSVGTTWRSQKGLAFGLKALTAPPLC